MNKKFKLLIVIIFSTIILIPTNSLADSNDGKLTINNTIQDSDGSKKETRPSESSDQFANDGKEKNNDSNGSGMFQQGKIKTDSVRNDQKKSINTIKASTFESNKDTKKLSVVKSDVQPVFKNKQKIKSKIEFNPEKKNTKMNDKLKFLILIVVIVVFSGLGILLSNKRERIFKTRNTN